LDNVEHHFIDPTKATASEDVQMASNKQVDTAESSSDEHFPYKPFGAKPFEHHFVHLGRANNNKVKVARNNDTNKIDAGAKPYEHHWIQRKAKKNVKMVSTNSITDLPNPDDFQEAQEAVFHAVERAERGLFQFAKRCEQAAEHAIEEEVDVVFCKGRKKDTCTGETTTASTKVEGDLMADPDAIFHALEKMD